MANEKMTTAGVTYTPAGDGYFEKRTLLRTAGFWGLWGIGMAAVISGRTEATCLVRPSAGMKGLAVSVLQLKLYLLIGIVNTD